MKAMKGASLPECREKCGRRVRSKRSKLCSICFLKQAAQTGAHSAGNAAGILIRLTGDASTELTFDSGPVQFQVPLGKVRQHAHRVDAGGVGRFAMIGPPPDPAGPADFELQTVDNESLSGDFPYWIRVTQVDQSLAWSSPVYVTRTPG